MAMYRLKTYKPVAVAEHDALGEPFMGGAGVLVTWEPTWEPKSTFEKLFPTVGAELIANYLREKERAAVAAATMAAAWPPPDVSTEERLAQQGLVAPPRPAWQLTRPDALSNITLDTMPVKVKVKVGKSLHRLNFPVLTSSFRPLFDLPDAPSAVPPTSSEWVPGRPVPKPWRF